MGEMHVSASTNGRRLTLDPLDGHEKGLTINAREVESTIPCGFQQIWGEGKAGKLEFRMATGAGWGSRWMTFHVDGHDYCINADDIAKAVLAYHVELYPAPKKKRAKK